MIATILDLRLLQVAPPPHRPASNRMAAKETSPGTLPPLDSSRSSLDTEGGGGGIAHEFQSFQDMFIKF